MADVEAAKALKAPGDLRELHTYVSYMKDKLGIHGWTEQQQLLQVRLLFAFIMQFNFIFLQYVLQFK